MADFDSLSFAIKHEFSSFIAKVKVALDIGNIEELNEGLYLHHACYYSENDIAEELMRCGASPFYGDYRGDTAVHYAVRGFNLAFLNRVVELSGPVSLNVLNAAYCSLLISACSCSPDESAANVLPILEWLYYRGASVEAVDDSGRTALSWAATRNNILVMQWLLSRNADMYHSDFTGKTPLMLAAAYGATDACKFFVDRGGAKLIPSMMKEALIHNNYSLFLSMMTWRVNYSILGRPTVFHSAFAWFSVIMILVNASLGELMIHQLGAQTWSPIIWFAGLALKIPGLSQYRESWLGHVSVQPPSDDNLVSVILGNAFHIGCAAAMILFVLVSAVPPGAVVARNKVMPAQPVPVDSISAFKHNVGRLVRGKEKLLTALQYECNNKKLIEDVKGKVKPRKGKKKSDALIAAQMMKIGSNLDQYNQLTPEIAHQRVSLAKKQTPEYIDLVMSPRPGAPKRVCYTCHIVRPARAHHCTDCGVCVNRFDHHCMWIDNCVGLKNQGIFWVFLVATSASVATSFCLSSWWIHYVIQPLIGTNVSENIVSVLGGPIMYLVMANLFNNVLWYCFVTYLLLRTTRSMMTDVTFYESLRPGRHVIKRFSGNIGHFLWDFRGATLGSILANACCFLLQSDYRDRVNYPQSESLAV